MLPPSRQPTATPPPPYPGISQDPIVAESRLESVVEEREEVDRREEVEGTEREREERREEEIRENDSRNEEVEVREDGSVEEGNEIRERETREEEVEEPIVEVRRNNQSREEVPETDARRLIDDIGEGGSNFRRRKREYEEELENVNWECKRRKPSEEWIEAVFNDHQLIQVRYMKLMSRMIAEEDREQFVGLVKALKESWEEAEEKLKHGEE